MQEDFYADQTVFAVEEPLHSGNRKKRKIEEDRVVKKPPTLIYAGAGLGIVFLLIFGVLLLFSSQNGQQGNPTPTATPTQIPQTATQIEQLMMELRSSVQAADPAQTAQPFPPVADQVRISKQ
jgi:predicted PurR-regulated permease PerM